MPARLANDGPVIKYSMPASIHRISDLLPSDAVVPNAGYLPRTMTAAEVPEVPGWPFNPTQLAMTFRNPLTLTCGVSSYTLTRPDEVLYCSTINLLSRERAGVSRIRRGRGNVGNERRWNGMCR